MGRCRRGHELFARLAATTGHVIDVLELLQRREEEHPVEGDIVVESDIIEPEPVDSDAAAEEAAASDPLSQSAKS